MTTVFQRTKSIALTASLVTVLLIGILTGCTTTTIDQIRHGYTGINKGERIVVLGRRHQGDYETEVDFIQCVGNHIAEGETGIAVISESEFADSLYPWFEPRTAPIRISGLQNLLMQADIAGRINELGVRYIVWIDGSTKNTSLSGAISCSFGGCLGFGKWDNESEYEASVWDFDNLTAVGTISADAGGTSYLPAIVIPIPLIAKVKSNACKGMSEQLRTFLMSEESSIDTQQ